MIAAAWVLAWTTASAAPLSPCTLETAGLPRTEALCGSVATQTRLNAAKGPASELVSVGFAVLEATGERKRLDPLVLLPGGPGQASTELAGYVALALGRVRRDRDVILFDPRGTGRSQKLTCKDDRSLTDRLRADPADDERLLSACAASLAFDPASITTEAIADDLEAVRVALGVPTWNLLGISYGTRLALTYDRRHPGKARSLVLDGVVPFSMAVGASAHVDADAALAALDARCVATKACAEGSSMVEAVAALVERLREAPIEITLPHPTTGVPLSVRVDDRMALTVVRVLLYSEEGSALLPPILRAASPADGSARDLAPLVAQLVLSEKLDASIAKPMHLAILCAEDAAFGAPAPSAEPSVFPELFTELATSCASWPHAKVPASFHDDLPASTTPTLLLSGGADPVTPPPYAERARTTVPNSVHLVGKGVGHNIVFRGCVPELVASFVETPDPQKVDPKCVNALAPFPLFIDRLGPQP